MPAIKKKYPESEITWITKKNIIDLIKENPYITNLRTINEEINDKFNILYNFDFDEEACKLTEEIRADKKYGFYSEGNYPKVFNSGAEYYLNTIFDDELKRKNKKTYQEMIFELAEIHYNKEYCPIFLNDEDKRYAEDFIRKNNINKDRLIGIHMGSSPRWPSKVWAENKLKEFIISATKKDYQILLFGGPDEIKKQKEFILELKKDNIKFYQNNPNNTDREFAALINICKKIVCADSFALHVALALKKSTVGLFFCTSFNEIEDYELLKKIVSPKLYEFFPERQDEYNEELINSIKVDEVIDALGLNKNSISENYKS
ncbi:MAG: glycosyltransferase family 9 protein [archaeon]|nr:glycosyltransferase family 9 protein [archaeon]